MGGDGGPELVIRGEHPVIAMPVLPRLRHEIGQPVQEVKRGGAHVEYVRGIKNPIGVKVGPSATPAELTQLLNQLNPHRELGRMTLVLSLRRSEDWQVSAALDCCG
jgi:hypothetical protein